MAARTPSEDPPPGSLPATTEQNPPSPSADVRETPAPATHKKTLRGPKKRSAKCGDAEGEGIAEDPLAEGEKLGSEATGSEQAENTKTAEAGAARDDTGDSKPDTLKSRAGARTEMFRRERFLLDVFRGAEKNYVVWCSMPLTLSLRNPGSPCGLPRHLFPRHLLIRYLLPSQKCR